MCLSVYDMNGCNATANTDMWVHVDAYEWTRIEKGTNHGNFSEKLVAERKERNKNEEKTICLPKRPNLVLVHLNWKPSSCEVNFFSF